jgi:hypothetical protein
VTLNTEAVREAINTFVTLVTDNKDCNVQLRYFTTSQIGTESKISDRPAGKAGLLYWRQAAAGADVGPLRTNLTSDKFSADVRAFVELRDDEELRGELLQRIYWDCGKPDLAGIMQEIEERLVVLGRETFNLPAADARQLANVLSYHVLKKSVLKNAADRVLTRAELYSVIDDATQISVSRQAVGSMLDISSALAAAVAQGQPLVTFSAIDTSWLIPSTDFATPRAIISRKELAATINQALWKHRRVILVGGSGLGKSLIAREVAGKRPKGFVTVDLRDADAKEATQRLALTLGRIGTLSFDCLIFDDFNQIEDGRARIALGRCMHALHRRDRSAIVTAYRRPSHRTLTELGIDVEAVIEIPYLTEDQAKEIVQAANGDPEWWGRFAFTAGAQGHPQLVHAFVMGMVARGWPRSEVREIVIRGFASDDTDAEREAARRSMVAALSEDARNFVYRLSLVIGRFGRALALKIAEVPPPISRAGELLDSLIGPWIEVVDKDTLRVSPLAANAGQGMLTAEAQQAVHAAIAIQMLVNRRIVAADASRIMMHGIFGKESSCLFMLANGVLTAKEKAELLRERFYMLPLVRMDQPIFPTNPAVSLMLRFAQFKLVAAGDDPENTAACVDALFREVSDVKDAQMRTMFDGLALVSVLSTIGIASSVPQWVELLQRFQVSVDASPVLKQLKRSTTEGARAAGLTFHGMLFSVGIGQLKSVKRLEEIFIDLDQLSDADRSLWLESADYSLLVNQSWAAEESGKELNAPDAAERYKRMALLAQKWGLRALAIQCHIARAVMFDEYMNDEKCARAALDESVTALREDVATSRARARIFWRHNKFHDAIGILRDIAHVISRDSPIDRAFALREGAISAANTDDWAQASAWFEEAEKAAAASDTPDMQIMAVGLEGDRAVAILESGNVEEALRIMASCLTRLSKIDPNESLRAAYCHRVVRHTVLWMESKIDKRETMIGDKPIEILAGSCSNPQPPTSITELPLGPLDIAWYMLAGAEASSGSDAGIGISLRSRLADGPILSMEIDFRYRRITMDILRSDAAGFSRHLLDYLEGMEYLREQGQGARKTFNPLAPPRGEVPFLTDAELAKPPSEGRAVDALIAFRMAAVLRGTPDLAIELQKNLTESIGENYPGKAVVDKRLWADVPLTALDKVVCEALDVLRSDQYIAPRELWEVGLRLFEKMQQSGFRNSLAPLLAPWLKERWQKIITNETFRLTRPMQTVPAIEASLAEEKKNEAFIASLLLLTADAVGAPLAAAYEALLKDVASGDRSKLAGCGDASSSVTAL